MDSHFTLSAVFQARETSNKCESGKGLNSIIVPCEGRSTGVIVTPVID